MIWLILGLLANRNVDIQGFPGVEVPRATGSDFGGMSFLGGTSSITSDMSSVLGSNMSNSSTLSLRSDPGTLVLKTQVFCIVEAVVVADIK